MTKVASMVYAGARPLYKATFYVYAHICTVKSSSQDDQDVYRGARACRMLVQSRLHVEGSYLRGIIYKVVFHTVLVWTSVDG